MRAGDYAYNVRTGECRLVIEYSQTRNEVTFSGSQRWESARDWRANVGLSKRSESK
jgi:hypothetical protein